MASAAELIARYEAAVKEAERLRAELNSLRETQRLLTCETTNRIADHLQLIASGASRQRAKSNDPSVREFADRIMTQVSAVTQVHAILADRHGSPDFANSLRMLCQQLSAVHAKASVRIEVDAAPIQLDSAQFVPAGLIASELVINAQKHAFRGDQGGVIAVRLVPMTSETSMLWVADSGDGFPPVIRKGNGLRGVEALARTMGGYVGFGPGSNVVVNIPNARPAPA
jgi:two-component sensor histidine kinase